MEFSVPGVWLLMAIKLICLKQINYWEKHPLLPQNYYMVV